jgi:D-alanyl-D-alanine carboxypeptidase (penicillin-binding protein 5/6)
MHGDARPARRGAPRVSSALFAVAVLVAGALGGLELPAHAVVSTGTPPPEAYILVDAGSGAIITGRHMHEALPPASIAKIMTALVAIERLPPNAKIPVSENASARESMRIGMATGSRWRFKDALASMMLVSANDSAYAVAEKAGGSIPGFAAAAAATAKRYGMRDSTFGDPAGLTDNTSYNGGPKVSAYDMAIATRNALTVPAIANWADTRTYSFTDVSGVHHELTNHNKMLVGNADAYPGATGFKTGYTEIADHTLVATAKRNGRQCIAVILGAVDSGYSWAASLLDQCWKKPAVATTGKVLPPIAVSPYESRAAEKTGFTKLTNVSLASATKKAAASAHTSAHPRTHTTVATGAGAAATRNAASTTASTTTSSTSRHHRPGLLAPSRLFWWFVLILAVAFFFRRRAVKKQRARRIARQRARAKAMRSGSLPVVDGRYRTGMRTGPPLESQVRIARDDIDLTELERAELEGRSPSDFGIV